MVIYPEYPIVNETDNYGNDNNENATAILKTQNKKYRMNSRG